MKSLPNESETIAKMVAAGFSVTLVDKTSEDLYVRYRILTKDGRHVTSDPSAKTSERKSSYRSSTVISEAIKATENAVEKLPDDFKFPFHGNAGRNKLEVYDQFFDGGIYSIDPAPFGKDLNVLQQSIQAYCRKHRPDVRLKTSIDKAKGRIVVKATKIERPVDPTQPPAQ